MRILSVLLLLFACSIAHAQTKKSILVGIPTDDSSSQEDLQTLQIQLHKLWIRPYGKDPNTQILRPVKWRVASNPSKKWWVSHVMAKNFRQMNASKMQAIKAKLKSVGIRFVLLNDYKSAAKTLLSYGLEPDE